MVINIYSDKKYAKSIKNHRKFNNNSFGNLVCEYCLKLPNIAQDLSLKFSMTHESGYQLKLSLG